MRKRLLIGLAILSAAIILIIGILFAPNLNIKRVKAGGAPPPGSGTLRSTGNVRVIDGDTVETWINGTRVGIGLIGISTPQGNTPCGQEAIGMMWGLTGGGIRADEESTFSYDSRGRRMYYVYTKDGHSIALEMVKAGLARVQGNYAETRQLAAAETAARQSKTGCLWRDPSAPPPTKGDEGSGQAPTAPTTSLPPDFIQDVLATELGDPTAFTFLPDGRILIARKNGIVNVFTNGGILPTPFIDLHTEINDYWDRGLIGIAADPDFDQNGYVYLMYIYEDNPSDYQGTKTARLTRVTAVGNTASPASEVTLVGTTVGSSRYNFPVGTDCIPSDGASHSVGDIKFASDGTMYITLGEASDFNSVDPHSLMAQNLDWLAGKMLHITTSGQGVPTNPFWNGNPNANRSKVFAYGLRNAYRFTLRPGTDVPLIGDVGWNTWEEVNVVPPSANLGWPCYEGTSHQAGFEAEELCQALYAQGPNAVQAPLIAYDHGPDSAAVTSGMFYTGTTFPEAYQGAYFYGDYAQNWIKYVVLDGGNNITAGPFTFADSADGPVDMQVGPDGALYYSAITSNEFRRIVYSPNPPPPTGSTYVSDMPWRVAVNGLGPVERDRANGDQFAGDGGPITLNGVTYSKGLGTHSVSDIRYNLGGNCSAFTSDIGIDDEVNFSGNASVNFQVWADNSMLYDSGEMRYDTATRHINIDVTGKNELQLHVTDGGINTVDDSADWAAAHLTCADTNAPTVSSVSPPNGATNVLITSNATATFSELMNPSTVSDASVLLIRGSDNTEVPAIVSYDSNARTVTIDPLSDLGYGEHYTGTVRGGPSGVKDLAGNALASDYTWTFTATSNHPPVPVITAPSPDPGQFGVGDLVAYSGYATDNEDGTIPSTNLTWTVIIHHCPGTCHTHPFQTVVGSGGSFVLPDHGDNSYFELILTARDSVGHTGTTTMFIMPRTIQVTLNSIPAGQQVVYNGTGGSAPLTRTVIAGSTFTIYAPSPQNNLVFASWSDGGAQQHNVTVGNTNAVFTATFSIAPNTPTPGPSNTPGPTSTPAPTDTPGGPTHTPTDTPEPTPEGTPPPFSELLGHVTWQGRPAQPNILQEVPLTMTLKSGTFEDTYFRLTNDMGFLSVQVGDLPHGLYSWRIKTIKYLANSGTVMLNGSDPINVEMGLMQAGDSNGDNLVSISDFSILKGAFGSQVGAPNYDDRTDFTGDEVVSISDFSLLKVNFGHGGAPPTRPSP